MPDVKARILLIDDHPIIGMGVKTLLEKRREFELIGHAKNPAEAVALVSEMKPDLIILDLLIGGRDGFELIGAFTENLNPPAILIYSSLPEQTHARRAFRLGAKGYVMKEAGLMALMDAIVSLSRGKSYASNAVKQALLEKCISGNDSEEQLERLSNQELSVFRLIGSGLGPTAIAGQLGISVKTVSSHRERIKVKLGHQSARELNRRAEEYVATIHSA